MKKKPEKSVAIAKAREEFAIHLCTHLKEEHQVEIGRFEAEDLFDELLTRVAPLLYNQALVDARDHFQERLTVACEDILQLEIAPPRK